MDSRWSMVLLTYYTRPFLGFLVGMLTFGIIWAVRLAADAAWHPYSDLRSFAVLYAVVGYVVIAGGVFVLMHVSQQFQQAHSRLIPNYAAPHLAVAGCLLCGIWMFAVLLLVLSRSSAAACLILPSLFLSGAYAGLTGCFPPLHRTALSQTFLIIGGLPVALLVTLVAAGALPLDRLLNLLQPWHVVLALLHVAFLTVVAFRALPASYRYFAQSGAALPAPGVAVWDMPMDRALAANPGQQVRGIPLFSSLSDSLVSRYHGQHWFRRLRLWQAGGSAGPLRLFGAALIMQAVFTITLSMFQSRPRERLGIIFLEAGLLLPVVCLQSLRTRRSRMALEWLRPVSRQTAVDDLLRGVAWDLLAIPLFAVWSAGWVAVTAGDHWSADRWGYLLLSLTGTYLFCTGLVALLALARTEWIILLAVLLIIVPVLPTVGVFLPPLDRTLDLSTWLTACAGTGLAMALPGGVMLLVARRKWLNRELG